MPSSPSALPPTARAAENDESPGPPYRFRLKPSPDVPLYYTIDNEIRDLYSFPPLLSVTASIKERRLITQHVALPQNGQAANPSRKPGWLTTWTCERYEVRERGLKDEVTFDSLRDLYPPPSLWLLGGIAGSTCTFELDPATGVASRIMTRPAQVAGGSGSAKLSRTAEKCALTADNLQRLLDDLGPLYLPDSPKDVGEQWVRTFREDHKNIGTVVTTTTCTLASVREAGGRKVAVIEIASTVVLHGDAAPASKPADPQTTTASSTRPSTGTHPYRLDKGDLSGSVEFDLTRGELLLLKLRRGTEFFAELDASTGNTMVKEIRTGTSQDLRVTTSRVPPPMPVIVGGKKPPVIPPDSKAKPALTTQPAAGAASETTASQREPAAARPRTTKTIQQQRPANRPAVPATQPVSRKPENPSPTPATPPITKPPRPTPTSQPAAPGLQP